MGKVHGGCGIGDGMSADVRRAGGLLSESGESEGLFEVEAG